jgi:hypothetical protein
MPFKPKGDTAQWRTVYDLFKGTPVDGTITYDTLADALNLNPKTQRPRIQAAARQAANRLLKNDARAVENVPETGYRIVTAAQQIPLAGKQIEKAGNALDKGHDLTENVRLDELTNEERQIVHSMTLGFAQVAQWARQINRRVSDHEDRLTDVEAELARLRDAKKPGETSG